MISQRPETRTNTASLVDFSRDASIYERAKSARAQTVTKANIGNSGNGSDHKMTFLDVFVSTMSNKRKNRAMEEAIEMIQKNKEINETLSRPTRHTDVDLNLLSPEDREAIVNYEDEVLGTYKNYKGKEISKKAFY